MNSLVGIRNPKAAEPLVQWQAIDFSREHELTGPLGFEVHVWPILDPSGDLQQAEEHLKEALRMKSVCDADHVNVAVTLHERCRA